MKRTAALFAASALSVVGVAGPAHAGTFFADPELTVDVNNGGNYHEYELTYECGTDGSITFTGTGQAADVSSETISGMLDTTGRTFSFTSFYGGNRTDGYSYSSTGTLAGTATSGTIAYAGTGTSGVVTTDGDFLNVPNCAPTPEAGNHGQYVSGAAKAGIKGQELAAIAKDPSLVGPYPAP